MNSVYIHIPFCLAKCHYCGFNSQPLEQAAELKEYFLALAREVRRHRADLKKLKTVYFGGGTPTIASAALIGKVMNELRPWP
ncbi:MAG: hypothetical protein Q8O74_03070, partial [bacterium]|nr:hypothetical protein [bacterium]